jgi:ribose transport system permease protein
MSSTSEATVSGVERLRAQIQASFAAGGLAGPLVMLLVLAAVFGLLSDGFLTSQNLTNILRQFSVPLILALGQTLVIVTAGIDLAVASTAAASACMMGVLYAHEGWPAWLAILAGILTGLAIGLFNGIAITKWNVPDFVATLGTLTAARGLALLVSNGYPVPNFAEAQPGRTMPDVIVKLGGGSIGPVPIIAIVAGIATFIAWFILNRTLLGRRLIAVGGNKEAARVAGINVARTKVAAYVISGTFAAVGGLLLAGRLSSANGLMAPAMELTTIAAVVLGGTALFGGEGRVGGTVLGLCILATLSNGLSILGISDFWQQLVTGLVVVAVVALDQGRRRMRLRRGAPGGDAHDVARETDVPNGMPSEVGQR